MAKRFKDLTEPERLYQAVIDGLEQDFPPPRTLNAGPNNLPLQLTNFIGRRREVARLRELLAVNRLLTLTGTGGTGKTRLALEVAAESLTRFRGWRLLRGSRSDRRRWAFGVGDRFRATSSGERR